MKRFLTLLLVALLTMLLLCSCGEKKFDPLKEVASKEEIAAYLEESMGRYHWFTVYSVELQKWKVEGGTCELWCIVDEDSENSGRRKGIYVLYFEHYEPDQWEYTSSEFMEFYNDPVDSQTESEATWGFHSKGNP